LAKWCVGKGCNMICEIPDGSVLGIDVTCYKCKTAFCFDCTKPAHQPANCEDIEAWKDWLKANAKPCPKCKAPISKKQGCMHMTCPQCKYEWCWLCEGDYKKHQDETGIFLCSTYDNVKKIGRFKESNN
jgi:ariadne-1